MKTILQKHKRRQITPRNRSNSLGFVGIRWDSLGVGLASRPRDVFNKTFVDVKEYQ